MAKHIHMETNYGHIDRTGSIPDETLAAMASEVNKVMGKSPKPRLPKKMSDARQSAQWRLDSACVRGDAKDVIDRLRSELDLIIEQETK